MSASVNRTENSDPPSDLEEIEIAEAELIDAYVSGQLSADERKLLEKGLRTSPELLNRLHFARLLAAAAGQVAEDVVPSDSKREVVVSPTKSWWQFGPILGQRPTSAFAAFALIVFIAGAGLFANWLKLRRESQQLTQQLTELERQKSELQKSLSEQQVWTKQIRVQLSELQQKQEAAQRLIDELGKDQNRNQTASSIASLFLFPASRSSETKHELKLDAGTSTVRLKLVVEVTTYREFLVEIRNERDQVITHPKVHAPRSGKILTLTMPTTGLSSGRYSVQLSGISPGGTSEPVANYNFRITTR